MQIFQNYSELQTAMDNGFRFTAAHMPAGFHCAECKETKPFTLGFTPGYGIDESGNMYCYPCCGKRDEREMRQTGKAGMYLVKRDGKHFVTNWPGTLSIPVLNARKSRNNFGAERVDFWFRFDGSLWHGTNIGDQQFARVKRTKSK